MVCCCSPGERVATIGGPRSDYWPAKRPPEPPLDETDESGSETGHDRGKPSYFPSDYNLATAHKNPKMKTFQQAILNFFFFIYGGGGWFYFSTNSYFLFNFKHLIRLAFGNLKFTKI
jgi:hypothetical protein